MAEGNGEAGRQQRSHRHQLEIPALQQTGGDLRLRRRQFGAPDLLPQDIGALHCQGSPPDVTRLGADQQPYAC